MLKSDDFNADFQEHIFHLIRQLKIKQKIYENAQDIARNDYITAFLGYIQYFRGAHLSGETKESKCCICELKLDPNDDGTPLLFRKYRKKPKDIILFYCGHQFHAICVPKNVKECPVCKEEYPSFKKIRAVFYEDIKKSHI